MSKNIEWLKKEVNELPLNFSGFSMLKQREEFTVNKDDVLELIDQLDEPEVLSQEWIDKKRKMGIYKDGNGRLMSYFALEDLQNLLVPKQELPVIPKFVAEFLEGKEDYMLYELFDDEWLYEEHDQIAKWLYDNDDTVNRQREADLVFAKQNGFTVEEEQKYYVMNNDNRVMLVRMMDGKTITEADPFKLEDMYEGEKKSHRLTEQEIKDYDPRYWAFRKPVEELEE